MLPSPEDGTAAEPRGSSWFPSLSLVYVRLAPGVFIYFMLWAVIQYNSVLLLNLFQRWPSGVPRLALLSPDTPVRGGWLLFCFVFSTFVLSGTTRGSRSSWVFPAQSQKETLTLYFLHAHLWSMQLHVKKTRVADS